MFSYSRESLISLSSMRMMKYKRYWLLVIGYWLLESYHDKVIYQKLLGVAARRQESESP